MADWVPPEKDPIPVHIRPPSFERRFIAAETDDADTLVALATDESYFVRRQAVNNPNTPKWILDLLVKAGATPDLRGKGQIDPELNPTALRRLAETGPWARQLVAEHPNTSAEVLGVLKDQPSIPLRLAIAAHPNADQATLASLCCDIEDGIRVQAVANSNFPSAIIALLTAAGAFADFSGVTRQFRDLDSEQLVQLAGLGAWGRFLVARPPNCPIDFLEAISSDPEWRVRSGLLDNPNARANIIERVFDAPNLGDVTTPEGVVVVQCLSQSQISDEKLALLAQHPSPEVRLSLARHPAATPEILGRLATDGVKEIRRLAAGHPQTETDVLQRLVQAGSTPDLMRLSEPDASMSATAIRALLDGGMWARQLAVRHPNTDDDTLARLLCDREPKIREWAAVHPNLSPETKRDLMRAGSGTDFQGVMPPDPSLSPETLVRISQLGSWGEWVVANNPYAPAALLDALAASDDWQVRLFVARNPGTGSAIVERLENDKVGEVWQAARTRLQKHNIEREG